MLIYKTNFADKLFGYAISKDFIKNSSPFCDLIDDPILGPDIELAVNFNQAINGNLSAAREFSEFLVLSSGRLDWGTVEFWTQKMYNYPVFDPEIQRIKFAFENLDALASSNTDGDGSSLRNFAKRLLDALKDCLNSPCNPFNPTSNSIGTITQIAPAMTQNTMLPIGDLKDKMRITTSGIDMTVLNKIPDIFQGAVTKLSQVATEAWSDVCNTVLAKDKPEELAKKAMSGTLRDSTAGLLFTPDINAFAVLSEASTNIMAGIMQDLGGCAKAMEHASQYNPYSSSQNLATPADIRGNNVNGNAYDQMPTGQAAGNPLPGGNEQAMGVGSYAGQVQAKAWDGSTALTEEVDLQFIPDAPYSYGVFGGWLDEKSKTIYIQDVDYKATGKGKERVLDGVVNIGDIITPSKSGIAESVLLQEALEKKKAPAAFSAGYGSLYAQGSKTNTNLKKIDGKFNHGVSINTSFINKLVGRSNNQSIEYSKIKALQQQNKMWGIITLGSKVELIQIIDCTDGDTGTTCFFTPYAFDKVTGKKCSGFTTQYGSWKEIKYKTSPDAGLMRLRIGIGTEAEVKELLNKIKQANPSQQGAGTGNVKYISDFSQRTRNKPLQPQLFNALQTAATQTKLDVVIFSGGQDQFRRTGSKRHDNGWGADVYIYNGNKQLDCRREDDLGFLTAFVKACRSAGCTGAGMGPNYMGGTGLHIDMASGNSIPSQGVVTWGDHLAGGGGRTPAWLTQAMSGGGMPGLNLPGGNIGNTGLASNTNNTGGGFTAAELQEFDRANAQLLSLANNTNNSTMG